MKNRLASGRYANALAQTIADDAQLETALADLKDFAETFHSNDDLAHAVENPALRFDQRAGLLQDVLVQSGYSTGVQRLIAVLHQRGRLGAIGEVAEAFADIVDARLTRATAYVTTARPLNSESESLLRESLERYIGKTVHIAANVDANVIGGVRARIGDKVLDGTIRARLRRLRDDLIAEEMN